MTSKAFMDASCSRCGIGIGWIGTVLDMPACDRCGHKADAKKLQADQKEIDEFAKYLAKKGAVKK